MSIIFKKNTVEQVFSLINFIDPYGLWETVNGGYYTNLSEDISRFLDYSFIERNVLRNNPNFSQMSNFISGEMQTGGLGSLSDGSKLAKGFGIKKQKDFFGGSHFVTDRDSFSDFWYSVQGDLTPRALDPRTLNKQFGGILGKLSYPGANNPKKYNGVDDYSYVPSNPVEFPAERHDLIYTNLKIKGFFGLIGSLKATSADWIFVGQEMSIALNPGFNFTQRLQSIILGLGVGLPALPKTIYYYSPQSVTTRYSH